MPETIRLILVRSAGYVLAASLAGCAVGSAAPGGSTNAPASPCWRLQVAGVNLIGQALRRERGLTVDRAELYRDLVAFDDAIKRLAEAEPTRALAIAGQPAIAQSLAVAASTDDAVALGRQAQALAAALADTKC